MRPLGAWLAARFESGIAEAKVAIEHSYVVVLFAVGLTVISLVVFGAETLNLQVVVELSLTKSNWWGIVTSIPIHYWVFSQHLLPNLAGLFIATATFVILFHENAFEKAREASFVACGISMYGAVLANVAMYFRLLPNEFEFGMSGVILAMGGFDFALAFVGTDRAMSASKVARRIAPLVWRKKDPYTNYVLLNMIAYAFVLLTSASAFQPSAVAVGQLVMSSDVATHVIAFGVGVAAGLPYFARLKSSRYLQDQENR